MPDDDDVGDDTLTCDAACLTSLLVVADLLGAKRLTGRRTQATTRREIQDGRRCRR